MQNVERVRKGRIYNEKWSGDAKRSRTYFILIDAAGILRYRPSEMRDQNEDQVRITVKFF